jgi:hypothetical protein
MEIYTETSVVTSLSLSVDGEEEETSIYTSSGSAARPPPDVHNRSRRLRSQPPLFSRYFFIFSLLLYQITARQIVCWM